MRRAAEATASATARSDPGSSTRTPPTTLTNTSAVPSPIPAWRPSTASTNDTRLRSSPETTRRGGTSSEVETSAWTSTSSGREPSIAHRTTLPGRAGRLGDEPRRGIEHLDQTVVAHLEHAGIVGGAEPVLDRADRPVGPLALALELQHAVDQVLEHARPGQRPLLGDVANQEHRDLQAFGDLPDLLGRLANLGDRSGRRAELRRVQRLYRVDHAHLGLLGLERGEHDVEIGLRDHRHGQGLAAAEPLGAQTDLRRRLLGRDVQRAPPRRAHVGKRHRRQRRLPDPRGAADQHQRPGHDAAAEHGVELADAGTEALVIDRLDVTEPDGRDRRAGARTPATAARASSAAAASRRRD